MERPDPVDSISHLNTYKVTIIILYALISSGCAGVREANEIELVSYTEECKPGEQYVLKADVFLISARDDSEDSRLALSPEFGYKQSDRKYRTPHSVSKYKKNPIDVHVVRFSNFTRKIPIVGVVNKGVTIQCMPPIIDEGYSLWYGRYKNIIRFARILDGEFSGATTDIIDLTVQYDIDDDEKIVLRKPDTNLLERVGSNK